MSVPLALRPKWLIRVTQIGFNREVFSEAFDYRV
jgi:hypothetical protein